MSSFQFPVNSVCSPTTTKIRFHVGGYASYANMSQDTVLTHCDQSELDDRDVIPHIDGVVYPSLAEVSFFIF